MYKRYSGLAFWLLSMITFGIYAIIVNYSMSEQHNHMAEKLGEKKIISFIAAFLLSFVTFGIASIVWFFLFYGQVSRLNKKLEAGIVPKNALLMVICCCIPIFSFFWMAGAHNKLVDKAQ